MTTQKTIIAKARKLKLLLLDVDGVLTDGRLFFNEQGTEYKCFHAQDGHGIVLLRQSGVEVGVISGRKSNVVDVRMKDLGVTHVYQGYKDKVAAFVAIMQALSITPEHIAYLGDDVIDLPIMRRVGLAIAVGDANFAVKKYAHWCTKTMGGLGAVREVCDFIMQSQGTFDDMLRDYTQ